MGGNFSVPRKAAIGIGGFDENWLSAEDVDFALRLKAHGAARGLRFGTVVRAHIVTSSRKFDRFGDWCLVRNPAMADRILSGRDREAADRFYYDFKR